MEVDTLKQEYTDSSLKVEAEYVSEKTMRDEWKWNQQLCSNCFQLCSTCF